MVNNKPLPPLPQLPHPLHPPTPSHPPTMNVRLYPPVHLLLLCTTPRSLPIPRAAHKQLFTLHPLRPLSILISLSFLSTQALAPPPCPAQDPRNLLLILMIPLGNMVGYIFHKLLRVVIRIRHSRLGLPLLCGVSFFSISLKTFKKNYPPLRIPLTHPLPPPLFNIYQLQKINQMYFLYTSFIVFIKRWNGYVACLCTCTVNRKEKREKKKVQFGFDSVFICGLCNLLFCPRENSNIVHNIM